MEMMQKTERIDVRGVERSRLLDTDLDQVKFGRVFSDHMFLMEYKDGAWQEPGIVPFAPLQMSPAALVLHYSQTIFEGMKAYKTADGSVKLFRPKDNIARMNRSADRMCMPRIPEDIFMQALKQLVHLDRNWIPNDPEAALYIRPYMFASDEYIGVRPSDQYKFIIFTCPVRSYYSEPVRVKIETRYSRAFPGGTGEAKCGGNYAGGLYPASLGQKEGFHQLVWTDGLTHEYIEESGTMNVFFNIDGTLVTPELDGTILRGITRDSILRIAREEGYPVQERKVKVAEIIEAARNGKLRSAFGAGTAATMAHIQTLACGDEVYELPSLEDRAMANHIASVLDNIRKGKAPDTFGWMESVG